MPIKEIADVVAGYTFRGSVPEDNEGSLYVLQAKNIKDSLTFSHQTLTKTNIETSHTKAFAQDGDVVVSARGIFKAAVLRSPQKVIASSSVYLLRLKNTVPMLPEFLALFMNSAIGQKDLSLITTGAAIKLILRKDLENIQVPVVALEQQKRVVALFENIQHQEELLNKRNELNKKIFEAAFQHIVRV